MAAEFRDAGYLQEVNRQFLHPLGLALEVVVDADGSVRFGEVWDRRDDPEGIVFAEADLDPEKASRIVGESANRYRKRYDALGFYVQPCPFPPPRP
jgi:hypothetical protein